MRIWRLEEKLLSVPVARRVVQQKSEEDIGRGNFDTDRYWWHELIIPVLVI
jgi:hypothetical protein